MDRGKGKEGSINYGQGGYHPVEIGDFFNKYVVQSKLGCGTSSTVWLAWDTQLNKYVALKITRSNTSYTRMAQVEIKILKKISRADTKGTKGVIKLLDNFIHCGPNGNHVCLVLELLGDNLRTLLKHNSGKGLPLHMVKEICFHLLGGLRFLHKASVAHADLKPENILLPSTIDPKKDPKKLGVPLIPSSNKGKDPEKGKSVALDEEEEKMGVEAQAVQERTLSASLDLKCKIADLGSAFQTNQYYSIDIQCTSPVQTSRYNCPEILLMQSTLTTAVDIWSVACIAFELATGDFLFKRQGQNRHERTISHLGLMIQLLGEMPKTVSPGSKVSKDYFDESGKLKGYRSLRFQPVINVLQRDYGFAKDDAADFSKFLVHLLDFVPERRPSAMEAIHHPWLTPILSHLQASSSSSSSTVQTQQNEPDNREEAVNYCRTL